MLSIVYVSICRTILLFVAICFCRMLIFSLYAYLLCTLLSLTASEDFVAQTNVQVTFDPNSAWQSVDVQLLNDNTLESTEYFVGMISSMQRGVLISQSTMSVNVVDDDSELLLIDDIFLFH